MNTKNARSRVFITETDYTMRTSPLNVVQLRSSFKNISRFFIILSFKLKSRKFYNCLLSGPSREAGSFPTSLNRRSIKKQALRINTFTQHHHELFKRLDY
jgi:hypothetical protein